MSLDLYWLSADNAGVTINRTSGRERRQTLGARTWGKIGATNLDFLVAEKPLACVVVHESHIATELHH